MADIIPRGVNSTSGQEQQTGTNDTLKVVTGDLSISSGDAATASSAGGTLTLVGGEGGITSGNGGSIIIATGTAASNSNTGDIGGETTGAIGTGSSGDVYFGTGPSVNGAAGNITLYTGDTSGSGNSGAISFTTGNSGTGNSGNIRVRTGNSPSGTIGLLYLGSNGFDRWHVSGVGHFFADTDNAYDIGASGVSNKPRTGYFGTSVVVGSAAPATSAAIDITSTTSALLLSRITSTQRDALTAVNGMLIYNTTTNKFQGRENGVWTNLI